MLTSTFQLAPGIGPKAERRLWGAGVTHWSEYTTQYTSGSAASASLRSARTGSALRAAIVAASEALSSGNVTALAQLLPSREHWRLFERFGADAVYLDIETSEDTVGFAGISAIGVLEQRGPRLLLAERDIEHFPELARDWSMLVTFNGASFDVPILRRAFPDWEPPVCHVDLRHCLRRLGHEGGLKQIERQLASLHLMRPAHLDGLHGGNTGWLYRLGRDGDRQALRRFAEYNLYDVVNLRTLMAYTYNALLEMETAHAPTVRARIGTVPVPGRGDVLYDISKLLLTL